MKILGLKLDSIKSPSPTHKIDHAKVKFKQKYRIDLKRIQKIKKSI